MMRRRLWLDAAVAFCGACVLGFAAHAAEPFKIGFILPMTGQQASTGKQIEAAAKLYMAQHGATVSGRRSNSSSRTTVAHPT